MSIRNQLKKIHFKYFKKRVGNPIVRVLYNTAKHIDEKFKSFDLFLMSSGIKKVRPNIACVHISLISNCNLRCKGCLYGRDFMPQERLSLSTAKSVIEDIAALDIPMVQFYGGEPLLHPNIVEMITAATDKNIYSAVGTNGVLLTKERVDKLYLAGLRRVMISVYGTKEEYANYVGFEGRFEQLENNIAYLKRTYPDISLTFNWLLTKPSCNLVSLGNIVEFSKKHNTPFDINLVHYDFPYFSNGEEDELQFYESDRSQIDVVVKELLRLKQEDPGLMENSIEGLRSIPDWLILKEKMQIPCHRYDRLWIAPNGIARVCQKNADLGNVNTSSLKDILYGDNHDKSAQNCFELNCTNCHVGFDERVLRHPKSKLFYSRVTSILR